MSNETLKTGEEEEVITDGSLPENYTEELLARIEQDTPHYPEDNKGNEQPPILDAEDYLEEAASRFGERDLQVSFEPTLMGRFDGRRLYHLEDNGQEERSVAEMMEKVDPAEKANFERRLEELALDGQSFDFNEETREVIVHIVIGENYYTLAFSVQKPPKEELALPQKDIEGLPDNDNGEIMPLISSGDIASNSAGILSEAGAVRTSEVRAGETVGAHLEDGLPFEEIINLTPVLEPELRTDGLPESNQVIASPPILSAERAIGKEEAFGDGEPEPPKAEPLPDPTSEPKRQPEATAPLQAEDDFGGISLIIESRAEIVDLPAPQQKPEQEDGKQEVPISALRPIEIRPPLDGEYGVNDLRHIINEERAPIPSGELVSQRAISSLEPNERSEQSIIENNLDGISLAIETPLEDKVSREEGGTQESATEIISVSAPEEETYSLIHQAEEYSIPVEAEMEQFGIEMIEAEEDSIDVGGEYMAKKSTLREAAEIRTAPQGAAENQETREVVDILPEAGDASADAIESNESMSVGEEFLMLRDSDIVNNETNPAEILSSPQNLKEVMDASPPSVPEREDGAPKRNEQAKFNQDNLDGIGLAIERLTRDADAEDNPGESATEITSVPVPEQREMFSPASEPEKIGITAEAQTEPSGEGDSIYAVRLKEVPERNEQARFGVKTVSKITKPAKTESEPTRSGKKNSPVPEQQSPHFRFANFTPLESPAVYGRAGTNGNLHSLSRAQFKAPSFLTGFTQRTAASLKPLESRNNFILFQPTAIVGDEEETGNDTINIHEPEFELAV